MKIFSIILESFSCCNWSMVWLKMTIKYLEYKKTFNAERIPFLLKINMSHKSLFVRRRCIDTLLVYILYLQIISQVQETTPLAILTNPVKSVSMQIIKT